LNRRNDDFGGMGPSAMMLLNLLTDDARLSVMLVLSRGISAKRYAK